MTGWSGAIAEVAVFGLAISCAFTEGNVNYTGMTHVGVSPVSVESFGGSSLSGVSDLVKHILTTVLTESYPMVVVCIDAMPIVSTDL